MSFIRVASLFIRELFNVEVEGHYFTFRNRRFQDVVLCGAVTKIKTVFLEEKSLEFFIYTVDDTSGCIHCVLAEPRNTDDIPPETKSDNDVAVLRLTAALGLSDDANRMVQMTARALQDLEMRNDHNKLTVGDDVRVSGVLKQESDDLRFVVIQKIEKVASAAEKVANFHEFFRFYEVMDTLQ